MAVLIRSFTILEQTQIVSALKNIFSLKVARKPKTKIKQVYTDKGDAISSNAIV